MIPNNNIILYKCVKTCKCTFGTFQAGKTYDIEILTEENLTYAYHHIEDMADYNTITKSSKLFGRPIKGHKFSLTANHKIMPSQGNHMYLYLHEFFKKDATEERKLKLEKINANT